MLSTLPEFMSRNLFEQQCGFVCPIRTVKKSCETGPMVFHPYLRRLVRNKGSTFSSVNLTLK